MKEFRPPPFLRGGHLQTLLGYWARRHLRWTLPTEDLVVDLDGGVRLLLRASWQPDPETRPTLLLVHGLGGDDRSTYSVATGTVAWGRGWSVVRMNMRGAGESETLCARLYHAGVDVDLLAVLETVAARTPRIAPVGFSLGANLVLLTLGRQAARIPAGVFAAAAVSPPLDLAACADALGRRGNRLYERHYVQDLQRAYQRRQARLPDLYAAGRERGLRTIREYDDVITAHYGGFRDAADYYERSSAGAQLLRIERPTLILAANDDPMIPGESVARWPLPSSGLVRREMLPTGGHVGFVARTSAPGRFWAAERVMEFLEEASRGETSHNMRVSSERSMTYRASNRDLWPRLVRAGLLTGVIDGLFSSVLNVVAYRSTVARLFQGVASVLLGSAAFDGGVPTVILGVVMHFCVAFAWSAVFLFLVLRSQWVRRLLASRYGVAKVASLYGPFVWMVMSLIVVPLFVHRPPTIGTRWWIQWIGHIPFVGLPIVAATAPRSAGAGRTPEK